MVVDYLELSNFRNYHQEKVEFAPTVNIFFGQNAQGKTNLLEALYYLALGRSFRSRREEEFIKKGEESFFLRGKFSGENGELLVELGHNETEFRGKINGTVIKRRSDVFGRVNVVLFSPDDLQLIKGGPQNRRDFLDLYLAQAYPRYRYVYYQFYKVLQQKNNLLKQIRDGTGSKDLLGIWNESFVDKAAQVIRYRIEALQEFSPVAIKFHHEISGQSEELKMEYLSSEGDILTENRCLSDVLREAIKNRENEEVARGISLVGPHRDDLLLELGHGLDLRSYGSQGQQRTAALALKMAMVEFIGEKKGQRPILLLDDVMSEFDDGRKQALLKLLTDTTQTVVTTADKNSCQFFGTSVRLFRVEAGKVVVI